ncbi:MAG: hypothetical protein IJV01_04440 [Bacteroidales bacterium]|nr:hypothetical protein [Bacteroidales bacterium]
MKRIIIILSLLAIVAACGEKNEENPTSDITKNDPNELSVTGDAIGVTSISATLTAYANLTSNLGQVSVGILYAPSADYQGSTTLTTTDLDANNMYTLVASNLASATNYYYKAFVYYGGIYHYGKVKSFSTKEIHAKVVTLDVSDIGYSKATLNGRYEVENSEELSISNWFLYSDSAQGLSALLLSGSKTKEVSKKADTFASVLSELPSKTTMYYVACMKVHDKDFHGEVSSFTTKDHSYTADAVDLGLSVKWSNRNLGAVLNEEYGDYFAWGEVSPKDEYWWSSYKWCNGSESSLTKYNTVSWRGAVDGRTSFKDYDYEDDAARTFLGGTWRIPTDTEWTELKDNCLWIWTNNYNETSVAGMIVTSKVDGYNDKSIFLPAAGNRNDTRFFSVGADGKYWSSALSENPIGACYVCFNSGGVIIGSSGRQAGLSVRPVSE